MKFYDYNCFKPSSHAFEIEKDLSCHWSPVLACERPQPCQRNHHSVCVYGDRIFLHGGRGSSRTLSDFWVYNIEFSHWSKLTPDGDTPPPLEGHSMVVYDDILYVFGGETSFASAEECPLWKYDIKDSKWEKFKLDNKVMAPGGRRQHTAVLCHGAMCVYGGYQDLIGPTRDLWLFDFETQSWHYDVAASAESAPEARYGHCAAMRGDSMWVCGGLTGLKPNSDVFLWNFQLLQWLQVKTKSGPSELSGHAMCLIGDSLFVIGGQTSAKVTSNETWRLSLRDTTWRKCRCNAGIKPPPVTGHCLLALPADALGDATGKQSRSSSVPNMKRNKAWAAARARKSIPEPSSRSCGTLPNDFAIKSTVSECENTDRYLTEKPRLIRSVHSPNRGYINPVVSEDDIDEIPGVPSVEKSEKTSNQIVLSEVGNVAANPAGIKHSYAKARYPVWQKSATGVRSFSYNLLQDSFSEKAVPPGYEETSFIQIPHAVPSTSPTNDSTNVLHTAHPPTATLVHVTPLKQPQNCVEAWVAEKDFITGPHVDETTEVRAFSPIESQQEYLPRADEPVTFLLVGGRTSNPKPNFENAFCIWQCKLLPKV